MTGICRGGGVFGWDLSIGRVAGERQEYASRDADVSTLSMVPSDLGRSGPRQPHQVGWRQLELQTSSTGRDKHGRVLARTGVEDNREHPTRTERADPADDITRRAHRNGRISERCAPAATRVREALEVELRRNREHRQHQSLVHGRHEGLVDATRGHTEGLSRLDPIRRSSVTVATIPVGELVCVDLVDDSRPAHDLDGTGSGRRHASIVAISAMLRAARTGLPSRWAVPTAEVTGVVFVI